MKQFFETRTLARIFANENGLKVQDAGSTMAKGERWFVEVQDPVQSVPEVPEVQEVQEVQETKPEPRMILTYKRNRKVKGTLADLGSMISKRTLPVYTVTQDRKGHKKEVPVIVKTHRVY